jgi:hypothetical protein
MSLPHNCDTQPSCERFIWAVFLLDFIKKKKKKKKACGQSAHKVNVSEFGFVGIWNRPSELGSVYMREVAQ